VRAVTDWQLEHITPFPISVGSGGTLHKKDFRLTFFVMWIVSDCISYIHVLQAHTRRCSSRRWGTGKTTLACHSSKERRKIITTSSSPNDRAGIYKDYGIVVYWILFTSLQKLYPTLYCSPESVTGLASNLYQWTPARAAISKIVNRFLSPLSSPS